MSYMRVWMWETLRPGVRHVFRYFKIIKRCAVGQKKNSYKKYVPRTPIGFSSQQEPHNFAPPWGMFCGPALYGSCTPARSA